MKSLKQKKKKKLIILYFIITNTFYVISTVRDQQQAFTACYCTHYQKLYRHANSRPDKNLSIQSFAFQMHNIQKRLQKLIQDIGDIEQDYMA